MTTNTRPADFKEIWIKHHYVLKLLVLNAAPYSTLLKLHSSHNHFRYINSAVPDKNCDLVICHPGA